MRRTPPGVGKPNSSALIQRNAVVMRVPKIKWDGRLRVAGVRLAPLDSRCLMMAAQRADERACRSVLSATTAT